MIDVILVAVILVIVGCAVSYIYKARKRGASCIGCPCAKQCNSNSCNCSSSEDSDSEL